MSTIKQKLTLMLGACMAVMAFAVPTASADTESVFKSWASGDLCIEINKNCNSEATGSIVETSPSGEVLGQCQGSTFNLILDADGSGYAANMKFGSCYQYGGGYTPCGVGQQLPVEIYPASPLYHPEVEGYILDMDACFKAGAYQYYRNALFTVDLDEENRIVGIDQWNYTTGISDMQFSLDGDIQVEEVELEEEG